MRNLLIGILLFSTTTLLADEERKAELEKLMWQGNDDSFGQTTVPSKWESNSAVILAKSNYYEYKKAPLVNKFNYNQYYHIRTKLQDNVAIKKHSEFSFPTDVKSNSKKQNYYMGFKVIKPDGSEFIVDLESAVVIEQNVNRQNYNYKKIAIPNLEIGDIVDYYICEESLISIYSKFQRFSTVINELQDDYPIVKQSIEFNVLRRCFISLITLNGAEMPILKKGAENTESHYYLELNDMESIKSLRWFYPYRSVPSLKFQIAYASAAASANTTSFLGEAGEIKSSVSKDEVVKLINTAFKFSLTDYSVKLMHKHFKKQHKNLNDPIKIAKDTYSYIRKIEANSEERKLLGFKSNPVSQFDFIKMVSGYFNRKTIAHNIVVGVPRHISSIDDLILEAELVFMIELTHDGKTYYMSNPDAHSIFNDIDTYFQGTDAYAIEGLNMHINIPYGKRITIPTIGHFENRTEVQSELDINPNDISITKINSTRKLYGAAKGYEQYRLMDTYDYLEEAKTKESVKANAGFTYASDISKYSKALTTYRSKREENKKKIYENHLKSESDIEELELSDFKILNSGRYEEADEFSYQVNYSTKDFIKKVGSNHLLSIGSFIDSQTKIEKDDREREFDIYMPYARSFHHEISFNIPEGYQLEGLDKLKFNVENETGGFTSAITVEDKRVNIKTHKYYLHNFEESDKWPEMLAFLDAAYEFSQKKILFRKI